MDPMKPTQPNSAPMSDMGGGAGAPMPTVPPTDAPAPVVPPVTPEPTPVVPPVAPEAPMNPEPPVAPEPQAPVTDPGQAPQGGGQTV